MLLFPSQLVNAPTLPKNLLEFANWIVFLVKEKMKDAVRDMVTPNPFYHLPQPCPNFFHVLLLLAECIHLKQLTC